MGRGPRDRPTGIVYGAGEKPRSGISPDARPDDQQYEGGAGDEDPARGGVSSDASAVKVASPPGRTELRTSDPQSVPHASARLVVQLADDILAALDSHDTHRTKHIRQAAERIKRVARPLTAQLQATSDRARHGPR